jgi:hypothetical protein
VNQFRGFPHQFAFSVFSTQFLTDFFTYFTQISTENIYRILIKQTGQKEANNTTNTVHRENTKEDEKNTGKGIVCAKKEFVYKYICKTEQYTYL